VVVIAVATKGMLGDLDPLGDGPCCGLADFLIVGGALFY